MARLFLFRKTLLRASLNSRIVFSVYLAAPMPSHSSSATDSSRHPAECRQCIDTVIAALASRYLEAADLLLDMKLDTSRGQNPGLCVRNYFDLLARLPKNCSAELDQLRSWLESLIEVVALRDGQQPFARVPMHLDAESLEDYCHSVMRDFHDMTAADPCSLELRFSYRAA